MQTKFTQTSTGYYRKFFCIAIFFALLSSLSFAQNVPLKKQALLDRQMQLKMQQLSGVVGSVSSDNDAGRPNRVSPSPNGTQAICQTFTGSLLAGDLTMPQRLNRPGSTVGNCTTAFPFPGTFGTGPYFYDVIPYTNASGLTQCATITLTSTDVTNANIQFGLWSGAFNPTALATNYLADPGVSTGTPAAALPITVTLSAGQTVNIVVWSANVNTAPSGTASNYTVTIDLPLCSSAPCSGTPAPGNTIASAAAVCASTAVNLSLQNATAGAGVTYQWQSATALAGPYTNITGATGSTYSTLITACTYFRANVTCSGNTGTSTPVQVCLNPPSACYCIPTYVNGCGLGDAITRVTLLTLNNTSVCAAGPAYYTYYNAVAAPSLFTSSTYPLSVTFSTDPNQYFAAWADFNQDGDFADAGEFLGATTVTAGANGTSTINISIPAGASLGTTRLRIRGGDDSAPSAGQSCGASNSSFGETEDYNINISLLPPCTGTPAPGNTLSTFAPVCSGANFTLSLQNATFGSGVTYQWQSSATGTAGSYTNITGATSSTYTTLQTAATFYQAIVTCGAASTTSNPLQVTINAFYNCYCNSIAGNVADEDIFNVRIGTLNNTSTCASLAPGPGSVLNRSSNYRSGTGAPAAGTLFQGTTMPISVTIGTCGGNFGNYTAVWIDFNHNGVFETTERVYGSAASTTGPHIETGNAIIPATALLGLTAMRVINVEGGTVTSVQPCAIYTWGETEDYLVDIVPCVQGVINTQPVNATIGCGGNATFSVSATGSLLVYSWEQRISATAPWTVVNNGGVFSGATTNTLTLTNAPVSMNGYQYRAVIQGGCTAVDYSNTATLAVTPYLAPISPVPAIKCTTSALQLFASPPPTTTTVCSPTLNLAVPDGNTTGVNTSLTVAGIAAGATISNINVKWNMRHTWNGDMVFVLKAPNGQILNLDYYLTQTGGTGATTGFVNTVVSSAGVNALSTGSGTYTGTFKADAYLTGAFGQAGPTGFIPTATTFGALTSGAVNGTWTLAMFDGGAGDLGFLDDWCINITWGVAPATAIFSPTTNLWLDAAATIPYLGTAVNSVYTTTPTNITYSAIVSNGTCTSAPTLIPVTVTAPLTTVTVPATTGVCIGTSTTITATSATGTPSVINYVWQVSTDGGVTYTTVVNNATYSGATTGALTISNATNTLNNYRYRVIATIPACGSSVTTAASVLTVNPNPVITVVAGPYTRLYPGLSTTLTASATPAGTYTYTWFRNGVPVPGVTGNTLTVNVDQLGSYTVRANNTGTSCTTLSSATVIADSSNVDVFIYPSPNNGQFQVRYYSVPGNVTTRIVNVYDSKGARVYSRVYPVNVPYTRLDVDIRNYGKGIYRVELADLNGNRIKTGSVIVL